MEVRVKHIGTAYGTVGWLAKGLESGKLKISEGRMKSGNHGLWLQGEQIEDQLLAAYNELGMSPQEYHGANSYGVVCDPANVNHICCSDACWHSLMDIADQWCEQCNEALENEAPLELKLVRLDKEEKDK